MSALVSVIIPTYNRRRHVREAIESVLAQSYRTLELIVIDDGSTDGTPEELLAFGDRLRFLVQANRGAAAARNTGIRAATGDLIAFLDSDDLWDPTKLEKQVPLLERAPATGLVFCDFTRVDLRSGATTRLNSSRPERRGDVRRHLLHKCWLGTPTVLARRECFDAVGLFDEELGGAEDWDMWIRISRRFHFDSVPESLVTCRVSGDNLTTRTAMMHDCQMRVIHRAFQHDPIDGGSVLLRRRILAHYQSDTGKEYYWAGDYGPALRHLAQAVALWPFNSQYHAFIARALIRMMLPRPLGRDKGNGRDMDAAGQRLVTREADR